MTLNGTLALASRSLEVFGAGIQVSGQNISNANTPGYIREKLLLEPSPSYWKGTEMFGTGVGVVGIRQQLDRFLETRIHAANTDSHAARARGSVFKQLEAEIAELGDHDLSTSLNSFLSAIHEAVNQPESAAMRQVAIQQGEQFAADVATLRLRIDQLRERQSAQVGALVAEANALIQKIADLNPQIAKLESASFFQSDAGALRSQRYDALNRLSEIMPIRFTEKPDGSIDLFSGSDYLILGGTVQQLQLVPDVDRGVSVQNVRMSITGSNLGTPAGELLGTIQGRDAILGGFVDQLDDFAASLILEFNRIHSSGEGLAGFDAVTATTGVWDATAPLNAAGLAFIPRHGSFELKVTNTLSGLTETTSVPIALGGLGPQTSLDDLQAALNAVSNVNATVTPDGRLRIEGDPNFEFRFGNDTSGVLAALGINTFFTGSDSTNIGVNAAVKGNHEFFATSQGGGPSDGRNALALARFTENPAQGLGGTSLDQFYDAMIAKVAQASAAESALARGFGDFRDSLKSQREQISGVSLDEEAIKILEFQRAFQSAARLISTIDELYEVLLAM